MWKIVAVLVGLVAVLSLLMWFYQAIRGSGRKEAEGEQLETTANILEAQRDATADRPDSSNPDDVLDRL